LTAIRAADIPAIMYNVQVLQLLSWVFRIAGHGACKRKDNSAVLMPIAE